MKDWLKENYLPLIGTFLLVFGMGCFIVGAITSDNKDTARENKWMVLCDGPDHTVQVKEIK